MRRAPRLLLLATLAACGCAQTRGDEENLGEFCRNGHDCDIDTSGSTHQDVEDYMDDLVAYEPDLDENGEVISDIATDWLEMSITEREKGEEVVALYFATRGTVHTPMDCELWLEKADLLYRKCSGTADDPELTPPETLPQRLACLREAHAAVLMSQMVTQDNHDDAHCEVPGGLVEDIEEEYREVSGGERRKGFLEPLDASAEPRMETRPKADREGLQLTPLQHGLDDAHRCTRLPNAWRRTARATTPRKRLCTCLSRAGLRRRQIYTAKHVTASRCQRCQSPCARVNRECPQLCCGGPCCPSGSAVW